MKSISALHSCNKYATTACKKRVINALNGAVIRWETTMKIFVRGGALLLLAVAQSALAGVSIGIGIGPIIEPVPMYAPPPVVYAPVPITVYSPPMMYGRPAMMVAPPGQYYGRSIITGPTTVRLGAEAMIGGQAGVIESHAVGVCCRDCARHCA